MTDKTINLSNNFHDTQCTCRPDAEGYLSRAQVRHIRQSLCPYQSCSCGQDVLAQRGQGRLYVEQLDDGGARLTADLQYESE